MEIEQADDNLENIEVSYSTHLRERENVQKLLKGNFFSESVLVPKQQFQTILKVEIKQSKQSQLLQRLKLSLTT